MADAIDTLIRLFRQAAIEKAEFAQSPRVDHSLHHRMAESYWALQAHGAEGKEAFRALLLDESPHVRSWVAAQLLPEGEPGAQVVLEHLRGEPGLLGLSAETVLVAHFKGTLRPPFARNGA